MSPHMDAATLAAAQQLQNPRGEVNTIIQHQLGRPLAKEDVVFDVYGVAGGFAATVRIPHLDLELNGAPCADKKSAQQAAAFSAYMALMQSGMGGAPGKPSKAKKKALPAGKVVAFSITGTVRPAAPPTVPCIAGGTKRKATPQANGSVKRLKLDEIEFADKQLRTKETSVKRTVEERAEAQENYLAWREERLQSGVDPDGENSSSFDAWFGQVCMVCLAECQLTNWPVHAVGAKHRKCYKEIGGIQLHDHITRPEPQAQVGLRSDLSHALFGSLVSSGNVLSLGEQDFSFSLRIARWQHANLDVQVVASSYLGEHDPDEPEIHVADDGERNLYRRRSLPAMGGALQANISALEELGGTAMHSVDATDLVRTLRGQGVEGSFDVIVFPFPRASLKRGCDPRNSNLLRAFFRSTMEAELLNVGGSVQLLLLANQYGEWDTAAAAAEQGFLLADRVALPQGFYQSREMSGKAWEPKNAELYIFKQA